MKFGISLNLTNAPADYIEAALQCREIDFVELPIEGFLYRCDRKSTALLERILSLKPATAHGLTLSMLAPEPWPQDRLARHRRFFERHEFLAWADHYAITNWGKKGFSSLTPAPTGEPARRVLTERLETIERDIPGLPFFLENPAAPFLVEECESTVEDFAGGLKGTKAKMLLDLSNLAANEINFGIPAEAELDRLAGVPVGQIHLAGGNWDRGFWRDSHGSPVERASWDLLEKAAPRFEEDTLVLIEREQNIPPFPMTLEEVRHAKRICGV